MPNTHSSVDDSRALVEPGSAGRVRMLWVVAAVLLAATVYLQQAGGKAGPTPAGGEPLTPPRFDSITMFSRVALYLRDSGMLRDQMTKDLVAMAERQRDRVRIAIVLNETDRVGRPGTALLERARDDLVGQSTGSATGPAAHLLADVRALLEVYKAGTAAGLSAAQRAALVDHHGWYGGLALSVGLADAHPERAKYLEFEGWPFAVVVVMLVLGLMAFVAGLVLWVYFIQRRRSGLLPSRIGDPRPVPGSLGVEMLVVFMASFLVLKAASSVLQSQGAALAMQWLILPVVLMYPALRGHGRAEARAFLGLHAGRGVGLEVAAGVVGWMVCLPLLAVGAVVSAVLMAGWNALRSGGGAGAAGGAGGAGSGGNGATNPVVEMLAGFDSPLLIVMLAALAVVWAPLVEETVFRGALLPHLRARVVFAVAAVGSALVFALMHGYAVLMLGPVVMLGVGFALIRAVRGSLVASMTAHAIHNGLVLIFLGLLIRGLMPPTP